MNSSDWKSFSPCRTIGRGRRGLADNVNHRRLPGRAWSWLLAVLVAGASPIPAGAAIRTWSGGSTTSGYWSTAANWVGGVAPSAGDSLVFPAGAARLNNTNNFAATTVFAAISVSGAGYVIQGNALALTGGFSADYAAGTSTFYPDIRLDAAQTISAAANTATLILASDLNLNGQNLTLSGAGACLLSGTISGTGNVTKTGVGRAEFIGTAANTFNGRTTVSQGTLNLGKYLGGGLVAVPGALVIGDGAGGAGADVVRLQAPDQIANSVTVEINSSGLLDLNDWSDTVGGLDVGLGQVDTGVGTLTLGGNVVVTGSGTSTISGRLGLGSGTRSIDTASLSLLRVNATITGSGGLTKTGSGFLSLMSSNSFSGALTVGAGLVDVVDDGALGTTNGRTILQAGTLRLNSVIVSGEPLTALGGKFQALGASNAWTGGITLSNDVVIEVTNPDQVLNLAGVLDGPAGFTKTGDGTLILSGTGANVFDGDVTVAAGLLVLDKVPVDGALPGPGELVIGDALGGLRVDIVRELRSFQIDAAVDITIYDSGLLDLNDWVDTIGRVDIIGGWITTGTGQVTFAQDISGTSTSNSTARIYGRATWASAVTRAFDIRRGYYYPEMHLVAQVTGSGGLRKTGDGWLSLGGSNSYSGLTTVAEGTLAVGDDDGLGTTAAGTVVEAGAGLALTGARVGNESLTFNATAVPNDSELMATLVIYSNSWSGPITLGSPILVSITSPSSAINLAGAVSGDGGLTKTGPGPLILSGTSGNTYAGDTVVREGRLDLAKNAGTGVAIRYGRLTIGDGVGGASADVVRFLANNELWSTVPIDITASGLLDLNGFADSLGDLNFSGGRATSGPGGILYLVGSATTDNGAGTIEGRIELSGTRNFNTVDASGANLYVNAMVTGAGGITKLGPGQLYLTASNSYQGPTTVTEGSVYIDDDNALGGTASGCVASAGTAVILRYGAHVGLEPLTVSGTGVGALGVLASIYGSNSWAGPITLAGASVMTTLQTTDYLHLSGAMGGGANSLTLGGSGTIIFSGAGANSYTGTTRVNSGTLVLAKSTANGTILGRLEIGDGSGGLEADVVRLASSTQIANTSDVIVNSSGWLDLDGYGEAIDGVSGSGRVNLGDGYLNIGTGGGSSTFSGVIRGVGGSISKLGAGTITFTGANTYSGPTTVGSGRLNINGAQPASAVTVAGSATLGGSGTVGAVTSAGGSVSPGTSPGQLTTGNLLLDGGSTFVTELDGFTPGSQYDQLNVAGTVNLGGAALVLDASSLVPGPGDVYMLIANDGLDAVVGTFAGLANGAILSAGPKQFRIYYTGGSGNDVVLLPYALPVMVAYVNTYGGNGNGVIDPNECNDLLVTLYNSGTNPVTGVHATLVSTTTGVTVTQARSDFADLSPAQVRTALRPFQVSTSPFLICGTIVDFMLTLTTTSHGAFKAGFSLASGSPGSPVTFNATDTPMAILDSASVTSTINVAAISAPVSKVTVSLYATHADLEDLDIYLIAPDGTSVMLTSDNGGASDSYGTGCSVAERTVFDSAAATSIVAGTAPFVGSFRPEVGLGTFTGLTGAEVNGAWKLRVTDDSAGSTGALNCWSLVISPAACPPGTGPCELCGDATLTGVIETTEPDGTQLVLNGVASACGTVKPCPGVSAATSEFEPYLFYTGHSNACVTVTVESPCPSTNALACAAYLGTYNPLAPCANYLADAGLGAFGGAPRSFSFTVPAKTNFWVVVQMITDNAPCAEYILTVTGADCRPALGIARVDSSRVAVSWPTYAPGYVLQSTNTLRAPPNAFGPVGANPLVQSGRYVVTNNAAGATRFYRLQK